MTFEEPLIIETREFNPCFDPHGGDREDLDVASWAVWAGAWPRSQTDNHRNAWIMDPQLNPSGARIVGGHPRDKSVARPHECIAARNARELAEHLGHCDTKDSRPIYDGIM